MATPQLKGDAFLKELERRSNDQLLVYNPDDQDFKFMYGGQWWLVPSCTRDIGYGPGQNVLVRYIAIHYMSKKSDELITNESEKIVAKRRKVYTGNDWAGEEMRVALRTSDINLRKKWMTILYKGIYRKFGMEELVQPEPENTPQNTYRPVDYDILDQLEEGITNSPSELSQASGDVEASFINQIKQ
jgi:hypothetical protein